MLLEGQVAIVTGGTQGLGLAIAQELASEGATVVSAARGEPHDLPHCDGRLTYRRADVSDAESVSELVDHTIRAHRRIDVLVTCAGVNRDARAGGLADALDAMWPVNVGGAARCIDAVVPRMRDAGSGRIIMISSIMSAFSPKGTAAYGSTKAAIERLTRGVALEYAEDGLRVNAIAPGVLETGMGAAVLRNERIWMRYRERFALRRAGRPREVARIVVFLAGPDSALLNGVVLEASGGVL